MREHGTYVKYTIEKCRCEPCKQANREYEQRRRRRKAYGGEHWGWTDAEPVRAYVRSLMAPKKGRTNGMGWKRIADAAGLSRSTVWKLLYGPKDRGPSKRIRIENAAKLLAVNPDLADRATVPAAMTHNLCSEIVAWYNAEVGTISGRGGRHPYGGKAWLARKLAGPQANALQLAKKFVTVAHARKVKQIHDALYREHESFRWRYCTCPEQEMRGVA